MDLDQVSRYWELLPHIAGTTVRWFAKSLDGQLKIGGYADSTLELRNAVINSQGLNFYVCPNPASIRTGIRHSTKDVSHWSYMLIDVDPVVREGYNPRRLMQEALRSLSGWVGKDIVPILIDSGRGLQAHVHLSDITLDDRQEEGRFIGLAYNVITGEEITPCTGLCTRRTARLTMRYWLEKLAATHGQIDGCKIDTTTSDLPRPMRCPGTVNQKNGAMAYFAHDTDRVFSGLAQMLVDFVPDEKFKSDPVPSLAPNAEWQDVFVHITVKAQNYLMRGKQDPGRHETMWHCARSLAEQGLSRAAVQRAIVYANGKQGPDMELSSDDVQHALNMAFKDLPSESESGTLD